ncbi:MAG: hypothetical protein BWY85_00363 [Firmicutes bacterium ADurb.Bin506]|jgi:small redox-active disulfide protein 2|nr:MAG: hypothetical protein BWY85_00363 [Firmicutes bacterium ADurb.Bin506]
MVIKILGSSCKNCTALLENTRAAVAELGIDCSVEKVTDFAEIARYGVMTIPALVVDDKVVSTGRVLRPNEIANILNGASK